LVIAAEENVNNINNPDTPEEEIADTLVWRGGIIKRQFRATKEWWKWK
jgi:hypothetical protein